MEKKQWEGRNFGAMALGIFMLMVTLALPAWAQELEWVRQAGSEGSDFGRSIAADETGNSYVTGSFMETATFNPGGANATTLTSRGSFDSFVAKYSTDGLLLWLKQAGGTLEDSGNGIVIDEVGNSYVTGSFRGSALFSPGGPDEISLSSRGFQDAFVAKYADDGTLHWVSHAGGQGSLFCIGNGIGVDANGDSYIAGEFVDTVIFGLGEPAQTTLTNTGSPDMFVASYADDGSLRWAVQAGSGGQMQVSDVAVDETGDVFITGAFRETATFGIGEPDPISLTANGPSDIFVAKYAQDGNLRWVVQAGGSGLDFGQGIALGGEVNIHVTGRFTEEATFGIGDANETELTSSDTYDFFLAKYAGDGSLLWARSGGISDEDLLTRVAADENGNSFLTGLFIGPATFSPGEDDEIHLGGFGEKDTFVAKYDADGSLLWVEEAGGPDDDQGIDIALGGSEDIYLTGTFIDTATFGSGKENGTELTSSGAFDIFVAKYDTDGIPGTIDSLIDLVEDSDLNRGIEKSLLAKLRNAKKATESPNAGERQNAFNILQAFINEVEAQRGKQLADAQADQLIEGAWEIIGGL